VIVTKELDLLSVVNETMVGEPPEFGSRRLKAVTNANPSIAAIDRHTVLSSSIGDLWAIRVADALRYAQNTR